MKTGGKLREKVPVKSERVFRWKEVIESYGK